MLETFWFGAVAFTLIVYAVLDGFDLGVGVLHVRVAKTDAERRQVLASIGPVWDGNEVWIVVAGATLYLGFPVLFGRAFSGFYLPLMITLWLLVFRALGIEMRHQLPHRLFDRMWDGAFTGASALLAFALGAALGNVVRGVSLDESGHFFAPLWTSLWWPAPGAEGATGVLDAYTLLCGLTTVALLSLHGALWLSHRVDGPVAARASADARRLLLVTIALVTALTAATFWVQPNLEANLAARPLGLVFPLGGLVAFGALTVSLRRGQPRRAFRASSAAIACLLASAAYAIFPDVLPAREAGRALTMSGAANHPGSLRVALYWWIPGVLLGLGWFVHLYRRLPATVHLEGHAEEE